MARVISRILILLFNKIYRIKLQKIRYDFDTPEIFVTCCQRLDDITFFQYITTVNIFDENQNKVFFLFSHMTDFLHALPNQPSIACYCPTYPQTHNNNFPLTLIPSTYLPNGHKSSTAYCWLT